MRDIGEALKGLKPTLLMVIVQFGYASVNILYKIALNRGMSVSVLTAYRLIFASAFIIPIALFLERNKRPKLTWKVLIMAFFCGLFGGAFFQNFFLEAIALISATFSSAVYNLIPAITFVLAVCCRLEKLNFRKAAGKMKVLGTITGVAGAMILTFVKIKEINIWTFHIHLLHQNADVSSAHGNKVVLGVICGIASCFSFATWLIIQAKMSKIYPTPYSSTALMSIMGAIQSTIYALCTEKDWSQWRLHWNIKLLTAAYAGIVGSGILVVMISWVVRMRGPLFTSVFNPLLLIVMAIAGSLMLDENLDVGSVIGAVLIVFGLYMVLWGKSKEMKTINEIVPLDQIHQEECEVTAVDPNNHTQINISMSNVVEGGGDSSKSKH